MKMTLEQQIAQALISTGISCFFTMFVFYYLRRYFDKKSEEEEARKKEREEQRKQRAIIEAERCQKAGRYFFWLYKGVTKPPPNGDLEEAKRAYEEVEARAKQLEQAMIADIDIKDK